MNNKIALVTGATGDIGKAIVKRFHQEGYVPVIHYRGQEEEAQKLAEDLHGLAVGGDLSLPNVCQEVVQKALKTYGKIDVLVNNAGMTKDGMLLKMKDDDFFQVMHANLYSAWAMSKAVCRPMMKARFGRIINISSVVGLKGNIAQSNYASSKAGLIGLTKSLARELAPRRITVNAVAPGFIETKMTEVLSEEWKDSLKAQIPLGTLGSAEDVAAAVAFLASDDAHYITGHVLSVDGGMGM